MLVVLKLISQVILVINVCFNILLSPPPSYVMTQYGNEPLRSTWNFGGHPVARLHIVLLLKTISYDYLHFTSYNTIIFDNNTKACFDTIVPYLGLMATECLRIPQPTITGMHFYIYATHGISKATTPQLQLP